MNNMKLEFNWAIIFVVMQLVWIVLEKLAGLYSEHIDKHLIVTNFIAIPAITVYVLALLDKRKRNYNGVMNYKQGFMTGFKITVIVTILTPLIQYIVSVIIAPEYFPNMINYVVKNGSMTQVAAENYFNLKNYMIQAFIGSFVMGLITTAIIAIFTRKKATVQAS